MCQSKNLCNFEPDIRYGGRIVSQAALERGLNPAPYNMLHDKPMGLDRPRMKQAWYNFKNWYFIWHFEADISLTDISFSRSKRSFLTTARGITGKVNSQIIR